MWCSPASDVIDLKFRRGALIPNYRNDRRLAIGLRYNMAPVAERLRRITRKIRRLNASSARQVAAIEFGGMLRSVLDESLTEW